ncbi:site-2 protease family protein [Massilia norwichensis]|uniref:Site-2 protease family protein n=1 Tax=Massilia norwichensis TaxID=1442366 RepID=A0ABT2A6V0_9BURK|nr:site-2 protease family protein [Massilia norwichensis]MCS0589925.1 site-2 protease family protein [Massilia norwichensis]
MDEQIRNLAVYALPVLFAITMHNAAQAYAAKYFGDMTAFAAGRVTTNPLAHIDPFGTVILPALLYLTTGFAFGYAKPLPIDYGRLRKPKRDMAFVALAGTAANFGMALMWLLLGMFLQYFGVSEPFPNMVAKAGVITNLVLLAFNLLPIPPMDGGRIVFSLLPNKLAYKYARIEPYGFFILLGVILLKLHIYWIIPIIAVSQVLLHVIVYPLSFILT